jgi:hypothetical protein
MTDYWHEEHEGQERCSEGFYQQIDALTAELEAVRRRGGDRQREDAIASEIYHLSRKPSRPRRAYALSASVVPATARRAGYSRHRRTGACHD